MKSLLFGWMVAWCCGFLGLILTFDLLPVWLHVCFAMLLAVAAPPVTEVLDFFRSEK